MRKWYPVLPIGAAFLLSAALYSRLPARMATHWGIDGQPNGYSSRLVGALIMPVIALTVWGFMRGLPLVDPRRANYAKFQGTYDLMVNLVVTLMAFIHFVMLAHSVGWPTPDPMRMSAVTVGVMTLILGNVMPRARSNWWFGIRTPWTLSSDTVWNKTHRVGGYLFSAAGVVTLLSVFLPRQATFAVLMAAVAGASLGSVVYSYLAWREEQA